MPAAAATAETVALCVTAGSVGAVHTLLGPDHYVPFVALARAGGWSIGKTLRVAMACGLGHLAGSVVLACGGMVLGLAASRLEPVESLRGVLAGWLIVGCGVAYVGYGLAKAIRPVAQPAVHLPRADSVWAPWAAFLVFAFGPCEPLVPLVMLPAVQASVLGVVAVVATFAAATLATMTAAVWVMDRGAGLVCGPRLARFADLTAGLAILACGILVRFGL